MDKLFGCEDLSFQIPYHFHSLLDSLRRSLDFEDNSWTDFRFEDRQSLGVEDNLGQERRGCAGELYLAGSKIAGSAMRYHSCRQLDMKTVVENKRWSR